MKIVTDFSVTSRPLRIGAGFDPRGLFGPGVMGVYWSSAHVSAVFSDTGGGTPAPFGGSVARVNDQGPNGLDAVQPSAALRPLLGRAPVTAQPSGPIDQGSGPAFLRFDLSDDVLPTTFPTGGTFDVMVFGRRGSWIARDVSIASAGNFNIGPTSFTGAVAGVLPALGDIVGWLAVDRTLSAAEATRLVNHHKALGAKGLLFPGPQLLSNSTFGTDINDWANASSAGGSIAWNAAGYLDLVNATGTSRANASAAVVAGHAYVVSVTVADGGGATSASLFNQSNNNESLTPITSAGTVRVIVIPSGDTLTLSARNFTTGTTVSLDEVSIRELRPEEDW